MDNISEKWTALVYDKYDKIACRTFVGDEETVNKEAKSWADKHFPGSSWTLHHQSTK
tara:strand:+ start:305 stop:475 length:171 start_codon:yes stop_codon:yes gene_type:complete